MAKLRWEIAWFLDDMKYLITSMGSRKEALVQSLNSGSSVRLKHLLKLYFYPEAEYERNGWMRSVWTATDHIDWGKMKLPSFQLIFEEMWQKPFEGAIRKRVIRFVEGIAEEIQDYKSPRLPLSEEVLENCCFYLERYHGWLANEFSKNYDVLFSQVSAEISRLLQEPGYLKLKPFLK